MDRKELAMSGWQDGRDGKRPRTANDDYMQGYLKGRQRKEEAALRWINKHGEGDTDGEGTIRIRGD